MVLAVALVLEVLEVLEVEVVASLQRLVVGLLEVLEVVDEVVVAAAGPAEAQQGNHEEEISVEMAGWQVEPLPGERSLSGDFQGNLESFDVRTNHS